MINQKQKKEGLFKRKKKRDARTEANEGCIFFFFFAFYVNIDSDETFTVRKRKEKKKKNRELLKRRINDGRSLSLGISCQNCGTLSPL